MSSALTVGASSPRDRKPHALRGMVLWTSDAEVDVSTSPTWSWGTGAPNHTATLNSMYSRTDAADSDTLLYRNTDGAATWEAVVGSEVTDLLAADNAWLGTSDHSKAVTSTDELINADLSINHATQVGVAVDATTTQLTTARTGGSVAAFRGKTTSLAADTNSVKYNTFEAAAPTDGGGTVIHQVLAQAAGYDVLIDLTQISSGEGDIVLKDNIADAMSIREGGTAYMTFITTDAGEAIDCYKTIKGDTIAEHTNASGVTIDALLIKDGAIVTNQNAIAVIAVANATGGATTAALTVDLTRDDATVVNAAVQILITARLTQYAPNSALGSVTFGTATKGSIITSSSGWCLAQTDTGGEFDCTATNAVDEALYFNVSPPFTGQSDTTKRVMGVSSNSDVATWSA